MRAEIEALATEALGDDALAKAWLQKPSPLFNGANPVEAISTQEGHHRVLRQLTWFAGDTTRHFMPINGATSDPPALLDR